MKEILKQIRARLFRQYEIRIAHLEAILAQHSNIPAQIETRLTKLENEKFQLEGKINHIEVFYGNANNVLSNQICEFRRELKQLRERPYGEWSQPEATYRDGSDNSLYVKRFSSILRNE